MTIVFCWIHDSLKSTADSSRLQILFTSIVSSMMTCESSFIEQKVKSDELFGFQSLHPTQSKEPKISNERKRGKLLSRPKDLVTKIRSKKDSVPMKLRVLPMSFWEQPNNPANQSPAPVLPPLHHMNSMKEEESQERLKQKSAEGPEKFMVSDANTDLLFSLFQDVKKKNNSSIKARSKKVGSHSANHIKDDDPFLVSSGLLPSLSCNRFKSNQPKIQNYSQLLSDLVYQL